MERYVIGQTFDQLMSISVYMKSESQEWTDFIWLDGSTNLQKVTTEAAKNINISFDSDMNALLLSSLEANENFWGLYRYLIEYHFGLMKRPMPKFVGKRKVLRKTSFNAGEQAVIENWFMKIYLHFHADCTVKRTPKDAPLFDYVFKFNKE